MSMVEEIGAALRAAGYVLVTAESCTGGLVASRLTDAPGSSQWFEGGFVTYQLSAKKRWLGVSAELLERCSAVSEEVVREMALGALEHSAAQISLAVSGVAGPQSEDDDAPVGTVWLAWAKRGYGVADVQRHRLRGSRAQVREQAVDLALAGLARLLEQAP